MQITDKINFFSIKTKLELLFNVCSCIVLLKNIFKFRNNILDNYFFSYQVQIFNIIHFFIEYLSFHNKNHDIIY